MDSPEKDLEAAFEKLLNETDFLLTQRQKMWQAFKAGAEWTMSQIQKTALNPPKVKDNGD